MDTQFFSLDCLLIGLDTAPDTDPSRLYVRLPAALQCLAIDLSEEENQ